MVAKRVKLETQKILGIFGSSWVILGSTQNDFFLSKKIVKKRGTKREVKAAKNVCPAGPCLAATSKVEAHTRFYSVSSAYYTGCRFVEIAHPRERQGRRVKCRGLLNGRLDTC